MSNYTDNNDKSVLICTPMYGGQCFFGYVSSLISNVFDLRENSIGAYWLFLPNESLITRGRNYMVDYFLEKSSCTHLMFIDSDIVFPIGSLRRLVEADKDVICAAYPKKFIDWEVINKVAKDNMYGEMPDLSKFGASYVINYLDNGSPPEPDEKGVVEVAHAGTGFMMIKRHVFELLKPHTRKARAANFGRFDQWYYDFFQIDVDADGVLLSEDWFFCNKVRELGGKIHLIQDMKLDHIGTHIYEGDLRGAGANVT